MTDTHEDQPATEAADRKAEQIRMCQEIAEMALYLARLAGQKAAIELTASDVQPADSPAPLTRKALDPVLALSRLTRIMHQALAHETRLTTGEKRAKTATDWSAAMADHRRAPLRRGLHIATEFRPDRKALRRQLDTTLDEKLTEDPGHEKAVYDLFMAICGDIGIKPDLGKIPDECLGFNIAPHAQNDEPDAPAVDLHSDEYFSYLRTGHPIPAGFK